MQPATPPAAGDQSNQLGLVSMILGIASIPLVFVFALALPVGLAATVLGLLALQRVGQGRASNRGQAITGIVCGAVGAVLMIVVIALPEA